MSKTYKLANDFEINRLGYGGMQLTGKGVWGDPPNRANAIKVLKAALYGGVNFFDTADAYGPYTNEVLFHDALHEQYPNIVVATKGGFERTGPGEWKINGRPEHIRKAIDGSLKRLGVEQIQLWQLHRVDVHVPIAETLGPVSDAIQAGKIKHVGLSEVDIPAIEEAMKVLPIVSVQNHYNLSERSWEHVVDYTAEKGIAFIPWFPLASGPDKMKDKLTRVANHHNASIAEIALAWLLRRSPNMVVIPGTSSVDHLQDNLDAATVNLTNDEFEELKG